MRTSAASPYLPALAGVLGARPRHHEPPVAVSIFEDPLDRDVDHARGTRTVVHVDANTLEAQPWTDEFREAMAEWIDPPTETLA